MSLERQVAAAQTAGTGFVDRREEVGDNRSAFDVALGGTSGKDVEDVGDGGRLIIRGIAVTSRRIGRSGIGSSGGRSGWPRRLAAW